MSHTLQKRTALILLCALWFQTGVALGAAALSSGGTFSLCRNGVLVEVTDGGSQSGHAAAPCVLCSVGSADGEPSAVRTSSALRLFAAEELEPLNWGSSGESKPFARTPPSRAPPRVI